jgi:hypothetical protein
MGRFLTTLPTNLGYYNLGTVEAYPTGGSGPTAYGPTSYFGSDPLPAQLGDSINNPADIGDFSAISRSITLSNTHGGNTRKQSSFYKLTLTKARSIQITQNYSPTSYQSNTNRNTIIAAYTVEDGTHRLELPINDAGFICPTASIAEGDSDPSSGAYQSDYPSTSLSPGTYIILITNDIRYLETTYSFTIAAALSDWGYVVESVNELLNFESIVDPATEVLDFGLITDLTGPKKNYPYSSTSGLGYTRAGVSP